VPPEVVESHHVYFVVLAGKIRVEINCDVGHVGPVSGGSGRQAKQGVVMGTYCDHYELYLNGNGALHGGTVQIGTVGEEE
jgi:hypothetical protein